MEEITIWDANARDAGAEQNTDQNVATIPITKLHAFEGHPYKVLDDAEMMELITSVRENGVLSPLLVRPLEKKKDEYEVISGHRRLHAAEKAGLETVPAFIRPMDRDAASILLVDSNLHREHILPSEKAFAFKMKYEAMRHQGTSSQIGTKQRTDELLAKEAGESRNQIQRYMRLTYLIPPLLNLVDQGRIALNVGVELSYLEKETQEHIAEIVDRDEATPSYAQAVRMHKENNGFSIISKDRIEEIMAEEKPNQKEQIRLPREELNKYFPRDYTSEQIRDDIIEALELLARKRKRDRERDAR